MKNILLTTLVLLSFNTLINAQTNVYVPFPDSAAQWNEDLLWCGGECDPNYYSEDYDNGYYYKLTHDTVINKLTYHLVNFAWKWSETSVYAWDTLRTEDNYNLPADNIGSLLGAIREDTLHRIYFRYLTAVPGNFCGADSIPIDSDLLLYDFSLKPGDTTTSIMYQGGKAIIQGYDSVLVNNKYRTALILLDSGGKFDSWGIDEWCEGIGSISFGLLGTALNNLAFEGTCYTRLDCFSLNNRIIYDSTYFGCDSITPYNYTYLGINQLPSQSLSFQIFPNPTSDLLYLKFSQTFIPKEITIYNTLGQQIYLPFNAAINNSIDVKSLPAGLYFIKATNNYTVLMNSFLKQ